MRKNLFNHCLICMYIALTLVLGVNLPKTNVYAVSEDETIVLSTIEDVNDIDALSIAEDEDELIELPIVTETVSAAQTSAAYQSRRRVASISASSVSGVTLKSENAVKWIDRVNISDYATEFYEVLEDNVSDADGMLIDVTQNSEILQDDDGTIYSYPVVVIVGKADSVNGIGTAIEENLTKVGANLAAAFYAFDRDHPEVFWLDGGMMYGSVVGYVKAGSKYIYKQTVSLYLKDTSSGYDIRDTDYQNAATIIADMKKRDQQVSSIVGACKSISRYKTIRALNSWLTKNNGYNTIVAGVVSGTAPATAWECISALEGKSGTEGPVCEGYARAFKVLCDTLNIPCVLVDGQAKSSENGTSGSHMWNYVQMEDGKWYGVDVTWNDPVYSGGISKDGTEDYLLVGGNTLNNYNYSFTNSHVVSNMPSTSLAYTNGPVLSDEEYTVGDIVGVAATSDVETVTYNYSESETPKLTAKIELNDNVTGIPIYQWYSMDETGTLTEISGAVESSYIVPIGKDAGTYRYVVKATVNETTMESDAVTITVAPYIVTSKDLEFVDDVQSFTKKYDGTTHSSAQVQIKANTFGNENSIPVEGSAVYNDANVPKANSITFIPTEVTTGNYRLTDDTQITHEGTITKSKPSAPIQPLAENITSDSITLKAVEGCEYSLQTDGSGWSENRVYTGLSDNTTYTFSQRYKETENTEASDIVSASITTAGLNSTKNGEDNIIHTDGGENTNLSDTSNLTESAKNQLRNTSNDASAYALNDTKRTSAAPKKGDTITDTKSKAEYKVTSVDGDMPTVTYKKPSNSSITSISVPKTITVGGVTYKVTAIADNAFKNCKNLKTITIGSNVVTIGKKAFSGNKKLKTIIIKTKKLTSKSVSNKAFAGISSKVTIKVLKSKLKAYTKLFRSKGLSKKVKVKK